MNKNTQQIKIVCFAGLRKFFDSELIMNINLPSTYSDLLKQLSCEKPEATAILKNCRIAIDETFVETNKILDPTKTVFLIPPSSGG